MVVVTGHRHQQFGQRLGKGVVIHRAVRLVDLGHTFQLRGSLRGGVDTQPGDQHVHLAQLAGGGNGAAGRLLDFRAFEVEQDE